MQIEVDLISYNTFINVIRYCELNNFEDPIIARPIKTNNLQDVLDAKNY